MTSLKYASNVGNLGNYGNLHRSQNFKPVKIVVIWVTMVRVMDDVTSRCLSEKSNSTQRVGCDPDHIRIYPGYIQCSQPLNWLQVSVIICIDLRDLGYITPRCLSEKSNTTQRVGYRWLHPDISRINPPFEDLDPFWGYIIKSHPIPIIDTHHFSSCVRFLFSKYAMII